MDRKESFSASDVRAIRLKMSWASLQIGTEGSGNEIRVLAAGSDGAAEALRISLKDGKLLVSQPCLQLHMAKTARWLKVMVIVPEGWKGAVNASTMSGTLTVRCLSGSDVRLATGSGLLQVSDVEGIAMVLRTCSGSMDASALYAEQLCVRTWTGEAQLKGCAFRRIRAAMLTGSLVVAANAAIEAFSTVSLTGSVQAYLPQAKAAVLLRSVAGRIASSGIDLTAEKETISLHSFGGSLTITNNQPQGGN